MKAGWNVHMSEVAAMRFVAQHTTIPVPEVLDAYVKNGNGYIFMTRAPGKPLGECWKTLDAEKRDSVTTQLAAMMAQLRELKGTFYGALWQAPSEDIFFKHEGFPQGTVRYGPFYSRRAYNEGLVAALRRSRPHGRLSATDEELVARVRAQQDDEKIFSHGDLHSQNIMVDDQGNVTSIIDWGAAGFSVRGRDYLEAKLRNVGPVWDERLQRIFPPDARGEYDLLLELDRQLVYWKGI